MKKEKKNWQYVKTSGGEGRGGEGRGGEGREEERRGGGGGRLIDHSDTKENAHRPVHRKFVQLLCRRHDLFDDHFWSYIHVAWI